MPLEPKQEPPYYEITDGPAPAGTKYYNAILTQSGTNPPTAIVLQNTFGVTLTWTYNATGVYKLTAATNEFTANKTHVLISKGDFANYFVGAYTNAETELTVETFDGAGAAANTWLSQTSISITVYP